MTPIQTANPIEALREDVNRMLAAMDAETPIAAIVLFQVDAAREPAFLQNADVLTRETRKLPGCNVFAFHKALRAGAAAEHIEYLIYENWQTRRQFQRQWNSAHLTRFQATVGDLVSGLPDLRFYAGWRDYRRDAAAGWLAGAGSLMLAPLHLSAFGLEQMSRLLAPPVPPPGRGPDGPPVAGWGPIPFPVPDLPRPADGSRDSSAFPFTPQHVHIGGVRMHYIEQGEGQPILFLHGNPTWSYIWRNIIPLLSPQGRCIAPDLIGFGRSGKPDIDYRWFDHVHYLEEFIGRLDLRNLTLVLHDQGSALGFHYAMRHPHNVKAIAFFEALVKPFAWDEFSTPEFRDLFRAFRTGGVHGKGWKMLVGENVFIEQLLPTAAGRPMPPEAMRYYREPFADPSSRLPIWQFTQDTAIGGEPPDVWAAVSAYSENLQRSTIPKLLLYATPGALLTAPHVAWCRRSIANLRVEALGPGAHFLLESSPEQIGREIAAWHASLRPAAVREEGR